MIDVKPKIRLKAALTKAQIARIEKDIIGNSLLVKACIYADIHYNTLKKALDGISKIKVEQITKLMDFCDLVKQEKSAA